MSDWIPSNNLVHERGNGLGGVFVGEVVKQLQGGRLKVFVPMVYNDKYNSMEGADFLPDAVPASPLFSKSIEQSGFFGVPDVGAKVCVFFRNEDANFPIYFAVILNTAAAMGQSSWNKCQRKKKYVKQLMKNGPAEISMDEHSIIEIRCKSLEGATIENGSLREASIVLDREHTTNRITLQADDIYIKANKNLVIDAENIELDSKFKTSIKARGRECDIQSPAIMLNANVGQGPNMITLKSSTGATLV